MLSRKKKNMYQHFIFSIPFLGKWLIHFLESHKRQIERDIALEHRQRRDNADKAEMAIHIGKPVIVISNEWKDPLVGVLIHLEAIPHADATVKTHLPVVIDAFSGQEFYTYGIIRPFSPKLLKAICKLDPDERWMLASRYGGQFEKPEVLERPPREDLENDLRTKTDIFTRYEQGRVLELGQPMGAANA